MPKFHLEIVTKFLSVGRKEKEAHPQPLGAIATSTHPQPQQWFSGPFTEASSRGISWKVVRNVGSSAPTADLLNQKFWRWDQWSPSEFWCTMKCENHWSKCWYQTLGFYQLSGDATEGRGLGHSSFLPHRNTAVNLIIQ